MKQLTLQIDRRNRRMQRGNLSAGAWPDMPVSPGIHDPACWVCGEPVFNNSTRQYDPDGRVRHAACRDWRALTQRAAVPE